MVDASYKVFSSNLHVIQPLERIETVMVNSPNDLSQLASDAFLYNPSDLTSRIDSLLSEFTHQPLISIPSDLDFPDVIMEGKKLGGIRGKKLEGRISGRGKKFNISFI
ncbi:hypothetical protein CerSpe_277560 [Prunus speciosa]